MAVSSYDRDATRPLVGSLWAWEPEAAPALIKVTTVRWNGEEWRVGTRSLATVSLPGNLQSGEIWNDLSRFWEACHAVAESPGPRGHTRRGAPQAGEVDTG